MKFKNFLTEAKTFVPAASTKGPIVSRSAPPFSYVIDTEKLTVTAIWNFNKSRNTYKAKTLKQAWWNWYNPWEKGGFMREYEDKINKRGGKTLYK